MSNPYSEFKESKISGIGGWLIIVAIALFLSPFLILSQLLTIHLPIFTDGTVALLTSTNSEHFIPGFSFVVSYEVLGNLILIFFSFYLLYLFFRKSKSFPLLFISFRVGHLVFLLLDVIFVQMIFPSTVILNFDTIIGLLGALLGAAIWIPYMLRSKRVKNTFIS